MAKLMIERQAVNDLFVKLQQDCFKDGHLDEWFFLVQVAKEFNKIPFAETEIIRCKDCKYASPNGRYGCKVYHFKLYETHEMEADDFCSRGERRPDATFK